MTNKQRVFIEEYLKCWNAAEAARRAGYSERSARQIGQRLLTDDDIKAEIQRRLDEMHMSADEALALLADIARGDMADVMDVYSTGFVLDMKKAQEKGMTKLIKKVKQKTVTKLANKEDEDDVEIHDLEIELYPADAALDKILRVHGKYNNNIDITSGGERMNIVIKYDDDNSAEAA